MPLVRITIRAGKSGDYKRALLDGVHNALVHAFKIPGQDRFQTLLELDEDNFEIPPAKTGQMTLIEISTFKGRIWNAGFRRYVTPLSQQDQERFKAEHLQEIDALRTKDGIRLDIGVLYTIGTKGS